MKVVFVTREDPIFIPLYLEKSLRELKKDKFYIVTMENVPPNSTDLGYLFSLLRLYGPRDFLIKLLQLFAYLYKKMTVKTSDNGRFYSVEKMANFYHAKVSHTSNVNSPEFLEWLNKIKPDIVMSVTCPQIFKEKLLAIPKIACLNIHTSLLPKNKSWEPVFWAMFKGEKNTGTTVHYMVRRFDSGGIIIQEKLPILKTDSWFTLNHKLAVLGGESIYQALVKINSGDRSFQENNPKKETVNHFPTLDEMNEFKKKGNKVVHWSEINPK